MQYLEAILVEKADCSLTINQELVEKYINRFGLGREKIISITNGYDALAGLLGCLGQNPIRDCLTMGPGNPQPMGYRIYKLQRHPVRKARHPLRPGGTAPAGG